MRTGKALQRNISDAVTTAQAFVNQQFPNCLVAFVAGSAIKGQVTPTSDLDLVVLLSGDGPAYKEMFEASGWPIEVFVITEPSYRELLARQPQMRIPALPTMCAEGVILRDTGGLAGVIQAEARAVLSQGPHPLTILEIDNYRFIITTYWDDLMGANRLEEYLFIAPALVDKLIDFILAYHRQWGGEGKTRLAVLERFDPALAQRFITALKTLYQTGEKGAISQLAADILWPVGGRLHHGFSMGKPA